MSREMGEQALSKAQVVVDLARIRARMAAQPSPNPPAAGLGPRAAVAAIVRDNTAGPEVLLIRRAERPSDPWSGHLAFPGGREEPADADLIQTAVRETREEVALDLSRAGRLLGSLPTLGAVAKGRPTRLSIAPFVFELTQSSPLRYNAAEVADAWWVPLSPLAAGDWATTMPYELSGQRLELPAHNVRGRMLWGLTHRMLESLFALLR